MEKYGTYSVYKDLESGEIIRIQPGQNLEKSAKLANLQELDHDPEDETSETVHKPR